MHPHAIPQETREGRAGPERDLISGLSSFVVERMDPDSLSKAFVEHYYTTFDSNRLNLMGLYQESSMLSFEGEKIQGAQNISNKLNSLPFQQCKHNISTVDCQPSGPAGGMLVFVSGNLQLPGEEHALKFSQVGFLKAGSLVLLVKGLLSLSVEKSGSENTIRSADSCVSVLIWSDVIPYTVFQTREGLD